MTSRADDSRPVRTGDGPDVSRRFFLGGVGMAGVAGYIGGGLGQEPAEAAPQPLLPVHFVEEQQAYWEQAAGIYERHWQQTADDVAQLRAKYAEPIYGEADPCELLNDLGRCVDLSDKRLYATSQWVHIQQILLAMEADGVEDEDLYLLALIHDLGKVLMLVGEVQENVVCANRPIGDYDAGVGLDNVIFQWNHDEFIYDRLVDHVPDHIAWTIRYHSVKPSEVRHLMDDRDLEYSAKYLERFQPYDLGSKTVFVADLDVIERWKPLLRERLPASIRF